MEIEVSRKVSQSFKQSLAKLKYLLSIFCETLRFISEPLREIKKELFSQRLCSGHLGQW